MVGKQNYWNKLNRSAWNTEWERMSTVIMTTLLIIYIFNEK